MSTSRSHTPRDWSLGAVLAEREVALMQGRRRLNASRGGRLVVAADDPSLRDVLEHLGLELDGLLETT